ncbi:STAS domain-containing protein [Streptacidiphilus melanogenes]|uniref:STAS domain-containing protein n=1 Tax=Streptacidiphilus melanogenes TaxID=411235 RepID=UPI000694C506|nr:STAS domain-containing protein [Streptacidiphilus melanogenes]
MVCSLAGDLDMHTCPQAQVAFWRAAESRPRVVCVDMREVTFCGSAALNLLLGVQALAEHEVPLAVVAPSRQVERLLDLTDADQLFRVYPRHELAVDDGRRRPAATCRCGHRAGGQAHSVPSARSSWNRS